MSELIVGAQESEQCTERNFGLVCDPQSQNTDLTLGIWSHLVVQKSITVTI